MTLRNLAETLRGLPTVRAVDRACEIERGASGPAAEWYVDAELTNGEAVSFRLAIHWTQAGWVIKSDVRRISDSGSDYVAEPETLGPGGDEIFGQLKMAAARFKVSSVLPADASAQRALAADLLADLRAEASRPETDRETSAPTLDLVFALRLFEEASGTESTAGQTEWEQLARRVTDTWNLKSPLAARVVDTAARLWPAPGMSRVSAIAPVAR